MNTCSCSCPINQSPWTHSSYPFCWKKKKVPVKVDLTVDFRFVSVHWRLTFFSNLWPNKYIRSFSFVSLKLETFPSNNWRTGLESPLSNPTLYEAKAKWCHSAQQMEYLLNFSFLQRLNPSLLVSRLSHKHKNSRISRAHPVNLTVVWQLLNRRKSATPIHFRTLGTIYSFFHCMLYLNRD